MLLMLELPEPLQDAVLGHCLETVQLLLIHQTCTRLQMLTSGIFESRLPSFTRKVAHPITVRNGCETFELDSDYEVLNQETVHGTGLAGSICRARSSDGRQVVIRRVCVDDEIDCRRLITEIRVMRQLRGCKYLHTLEDILVPPSCSAWWSEVYLIQPAFTCDMSRIIKSQGNLSADHIKWFMSRILSGLEALHAAGVMHRNLNPTIICSTTNDDHWISGFDFAFSTYNIPDGIESAVGVRWYRAPELLLGNATHDEAVDIWSAGCILAELHTRRPLFPGRYEIHQLELILRFLGTPSDSDMTTVTHPKAAAFVNTCCREQQHEPVIPATLQQADPLLLDLVHRMLTFDPRKRITVKDALRHAYMQEYLEDAPLDAPDSPAPIEMGLDGKDLLRQLWAEIRAFNPCIGPCPRESCKGLKGV